jgi:uncharacterized Zn-binding protein involved in type VI secretion
MPAAAHLGDLTTNTHLCNQSVAIDNSTHLAHNTNLAGGVTIQGIPAAVVGSKLADHTIDSGGSCIPHPGQTVTQGSSSVTVNGKALAYQGATVSCAGGEITGAAGTVTVVA